MQYAPKYKLILLLHDINCTSEDKNQNIMTESVCVLSCFSCARLFAALWTIARQAPPSMGFSRQEYWSGLPALLQGIFPNHGLNTCLLRWQAGPLLLALGSPKTGVKFVIFFPNIYIFFIYFH